MRGFISGLAEPVRKPGFWLILGILTLIAIPHYGHLLDHPAFLKDITEQLGLNREAFERILFLAPIIWAGFLFGWRGAMTTSLAALALMLPLALTTSAHPRDALFETGAVFVVGNLVAFSFEALSKERQRRSELAALNETCSAASRYLELGHVLDSSIGSVINVMKVNAGMVFLMNEEGTELALSAYEGISPEFARSVGKIPFGEGFNGRVARTGEPLIVADASRDASLTRLVVWEEGIRSQLIVPLISKGKVLGTLCVASHSRRKFNGHEVELLKAMGNQIGVAVENARLYEQERAVAEQLRQSEERYRRLFEDAHDAIWIRDLRGNIIAANKSCVGLTGYSLDELRNLNADTLLAEEFAPVRRTEDRALPEDITGISEVTLLKKDGSRASVQLSTSPVCSNGRVEAFQCIARDVTEEKMMRENLSFYLQQVTRAQEEERKRIARELHDETIQALVVLSRQIDDMASRGENLSAQEKQLLERLWQQTRGIMEGLRRLSQDLRPATLDKLGLLSALDWLASDIGKLSGIEIELSVLGAERRIAPEAELVLFRIAQEALRNVWRHSKAGKAVVTVDFREGPIRLTVSDNGKGFDLRHRRGDLTREGRLGLAGMEERARLLGGSLSIDSAPGEGTTVTVEAPI